MAAVAFDTLEFVETLKEGEVSETQAKAIAKAVRNSQESAELATKEDLDKLETCLRHEISDSRKDADSKYEALRHDIQDLRKEVDNSRKEVDSKLEKMDLRLRGEMKLIHSEMKLIRWMFGAVMTGVISIASGLVILILKTSVITHI